MIKEPVNQDLPQDDPSASFYLFRCVQCEKRLLNRSVGLIHMNVTHRIFIDIPEFLENQRQYFSQMDFHGTRREQQNHEYSKYLYFLKNKTLKIVPGDRRDELPKIKQDVLLSIQGTGLKASHKTGRRGKNPMQGQKNEQGISEMDLYVD